MTVSQEQSYVVILGMGLMAAGMSRSPSSIQIGLATVGVSFWLGSAWFIAFGSAYLHQIDMRWMARVTVYVIAVSGAALVLRLLGYRIIKLFPSTVMTESRAVMERDFDDWFRLLEQIPGDVQSSQELHGRLRESGLDSTSATLVSNAYARLTGLIPIGKTFDGRRELVSVVTLTVAACLYVGFTVMRQHGYRLIRICHIKPASSDDRGSCQL